MILSLSIGLVLSREQARQNILQVANLIKGHQGYQSLAIGHAGITSLFLHIIEGDKKYDVAEISLKRGNQIVLSRIFQNKTINHYQLSPFVITQDLSLLTYTVQMKVLLRPHLIFQIFFYSLIFSFIVVIGFLVNKIFARKNLEIILAREKEELAKQVSHDIRSPLAALNMFSNSVTSLPEAQRLIMRNSIERINDIANNLLNRKTNQNKKTEIRPCLLSSLVDSIASEKRIMLRDKNNIELSTKISIDSYGLFSDLDIIEAKRAISNLVNNAMEALIDGGKIEIGVTEKLDKNVIYVKDNGKGMPPELLEKIGQKGITKGKENSTSGSGLGVYGTKNAVESWNGELIYSSKEGFGTTASIILPKSKTPKWFIEKLLISSSYQLNILDDDPSIHSIWDKRFEDSNLIINHFYKPSDIRSWVNLYKNESALFLCDYELIGYSETGLTLIKELNIKDSAFLVTSRYEEEYIINECENLEIGLIPKSLAGCVPIEIENNTNKINHENIKKKEVILLDDDELIRLTWEYQAKAKGILLKVYSRKDEMFKDLDQFDLESTFYIDSNLENDVKGEDVAKELFNLGFKNLILATGFEKDQFAGLAFIKDVIGKNAPF